MKHGHLISPVTESTDTNSHHCKSCLVIIHPHLAVDYGAKPHTLKTDLDAEVFDIVGNHPHS